MSCRIFAWRAPSHQIACELFGHRRDDRERHTGPASISTSGSTGSLRAPSAGTSRRSLRHSPRSARRAHLVDRGRAHPVTLVAVGSFSFVAPCQRHPLDYLQGVASIRRAWPGCWGRRMVRPPRSTRICAPCRIARVVGQPELSCVDGSTPASPQLISCSCASGDAAACDRAVEADAAASRATAATRRRAADRSRSASSEDCRVRTFVGTLTITVRRCRVTGYHAPARPVERRPLAHRRNSPCRSECALCDGLTGSPSAVRRSIGDRIA